MRTPAVTTRRVNATRLSAHDPTPPIRATRGLAVAGLAALGIALAACNTDNDNGPADDNDTTPPAEQAGPVAECVVGDWRSTDLEGEIGGVAGEGTVSGGSGVALTIDPDGTATLDFSGMEPAVFEGQIAEVEIGGELTYDGQAIGTIRTDVDTTAGAWEPVEPTDWSDVRVTAEVTEPVEGRPLDDTPLGDVIDEADEVTGDVVDVDPVLGEGSFECRNDTLVVNPAADAGMTWTFSRD